MQSMSCMHIYASKMRCPWFSLVNSQALKRPPFDRPCCRQGLWLHTRRSLGVSTAADALREPIRPGALQGLGAVAPGSPWSRNCNVTRCQGCVITADLAFFRSQVQVTMLNMFQEGKLHLLTSTNTSLPSFAFTNSLRLKTLVVCPFSFQKLGASLRS
jgi:hypothetical protein